MNTVVLKIFALLLILEGNLYAQYNNADYSISLNAVYTTTAKIYLTPFSSDPILRNNSFPMADILSPSVEFKYRLTEPLILGISTEYMTHTEGGYNLTVFDGNSTATIFVEDGFRFIPLELSIYYILPFSTENFKFLMGGGAGYYFGEHLRKVGDASVSNEERKTAYGIHVSAAVDYLLLYNTLAHFEMKFRDPQFTVKSRYPDKTINYEGRTLRLAQETFDSKINIDGITFILGFSYQF